MGQYRAQIVYPYFTGLARDVAVNTFHFIDDDDDFTASTTEIATRLSGLLGDIYGSSGAVRVPYIDWQNLEIKVFDLDQTPPRIPNIETGFFTSAGSANTAIPTEVAMVASWFAAPVSGVPHQRLYNRVFLPGIPTNWLDTATTSQFPKFATARMALIATAFQTLRDADTTDLTWVQTSTAGGTRVNRQIAGGFVDNAPDSQRRRSVDPTLRETWLPT